MRRLRAFAVRSSSGWLSEVPRKLAAGWVPALPLRPQPGVPLASVPHSTLPSWLTTRTYCPLGQLPLTRRWTCVASIWTVPMPPAATSMVPVLVIGPPVRPAPVAMLVTVPPESASLPQLTLPSWATTRTYSPAGQLPVTRRWICAALMSAPSMVPSTMLVVVTEFASATAALQAYGAAVTSVRGLSVS